MEIDKLINKVEYSKYLDYSNHLIPNLESVYVFDINGKVIWSSNSANKSVKHIKINNKNLSGDPDMQKNNVFSLQLRDSKNIYVKYLFYLNNECYGGIAYLTSSEQHKKSIIRYLKFIATVISAEVELSSELDAMSYELSERYEELNLVYDSEDAVVTTGSGPEVLEQLVTNCTEYLDVAMTALIMPNEELTVYDINGSEKIHYVHSILAQFKNYSYPWMLKNGLSIVSNDLADNFRQEVFPDIPYKIICSPVYVTETAIGGILITMNPNNRDDFSNSDRNLLEAMAKKAAKIAMAHYDNLTGLFKREAYEVFLDRALESSHKEGKTYCILHIDIDGIKIVNETIDPKAGDYLLIEVAKLIRGNTRDSDIVARIMGDKFSVLLDSCVLQAGCSIADNIREAIQDMKCSWHGSKFDVTACIGVTELNADSENIQSVIAASELATGYAKENGRNIVQVYQQGDTMLQRRQGEVHWIRAIQKALKTDQFELYCQPIIPINGQSDTTHYEILLRMHDDAGALVSPDSFIPAAERFRLMSSIDLWVVDHAFSLISKFKSISENFMWTINLSGLSLEKIDIAQEIYEISDNYNIIPSHICFEMTETATMNNFIEVNKFIHFLKSKGFSFALDDFGTGSSTFTYLKKLPVEYLKIDGSFIKDILNDSFADSIVCSINQVSHARGMQTIAEYVENDDILARIKEIGIDFAQGYGIGKPAPLEESLIELMTRDDQVANSM